MTTVFKLNHPTKNGFGNLFENLMKDIPATFTESRFAPQVNIAETNDAYILELNAPGRQKEDFSINIDKNLLTIAYQPKETPANENLKQIRKEFNNNAFSRTFTIDEKIATDNIAAKYENGILNVTLPKKEEVKVSPKQIAIQ